MDGLTPKERFGGWEDYRRTLREVDRLVGAGELTPIPAAEPSPGYSEEFYFADTSGALWRLAEPDPPAAGSWTRVDAVGRHGSLWVPLTGDDGTTP